MKSIRPLRSSDIVLLMAVTSDRQEAEGRRDRKKRLPKAKSRSKSCKIPRGNFRHRGVFGGQKREKGGQKRVFDPPQPFPYICKETGFGGSRTPFFVEDSRLLPKTQGELLTPFENHRAQRRDGQNTRELLTPLEESRLFLVKK